MNLAFRTGERDGDLECVLKCDGWKRVTFVNAVGLVNTIPAEERALLGSKNELALQRVATSCQRYMAQASDEAFGLRLCDADRRVDERLIHLWMEW